MSGQEIQWWQFFLSVPGILPRPSHGPCKPGCYLKPRAIFLGTYWKSSYFIIVSVFFQGKTNFQISFWIPQVFHLSMRFSWITWKLKKDADSRTTFNKHKILFPRINKTSNLMVKCFLVMKILMLTMTWHFICYP